MKYYDLVYMLVIFQAARFFSVQLLELRMVRLTDMASDWGFTALGRRDYPNASTQFRASDLHGLFSTRT